MVVLPGFVLMNFSMFFAGLAYAVALLGIGSKPLFSWGSSTSQEATPAAPRTREIYTPALIRPLQRDPFVLAPMIIGGVFSLIGLGMMMTP